MPVPWIRVAFAVFAVSWGANQFAPLQLVYREHSGLCSSAFAAMLGTYALGLIPSLLYFGQLSDRRGRRFVIRPMIAVAIASSLILVAGADLPALLYVGRIFAGIASGMAFAAGGAWIKELSEADGPGAGARRAAVSLSAGFGCGGLFGGLIAQWLPAPEVVPYLAHIALMIGAGVVVWGAPETRTSRLAGTKLCLTALRSRYFVGGVAPWAPWVFGTAALAFTTLPPHAAESTGSLSIAFTGTIAALTLLTGALVQPWARKLSTHGDMTAVGTGVLLAAAGFLTAGIALSTDGGLSVSLIVIASVLLGSAYGVLLVSGLVIVEKNATAEDLAGTIALFYCFVYVGFAVPFVFSLLEPHIGYPLCLTGATVLMSVGFAFAARSSRQLSASTVTLTPRA